MAEESKLTVERLSALLGISDPDETVKVHLEFALENAEDTVKNYCHIDEIPAGLETTVLRMAMDIYRNEHMGSAIYHRRFLRCRSAIQQHLLRLPRRSSRKAL